MIKIGILIDRLNVGGVEKIAIEQVRALRNIGEDAVLIVLRRKAVIEGAFSDILEGVPIEYLDDRLPSWLRGSFNFPIFHFFAFFHLSYPILLPWTLKKGEYDYIICHGTYTAFSAIMIRKIKKIPFSCFIWDPIGYILQRVYREKFSKPMFLFLFAIANHVDRIILKNSDKILVGGDAHNEHLRLLKSDIEIVEIHPSVHPIVDQIEKKDYVLLVTAWKSGKHPEYIFELVEKIPEIRVKMVGKWIEEVYRKEFECEIDSRKLKNNIEIIGAVTERELQRYYAEATVLLQTNDDKGFGMPALEAAGNGTTFIIPEGQGVCSLFQNGIDGYFTKEKETETIVQHLHFLLANRNESENMGRHALETVRNSYSWEKHALALQIIIRECLYHSL
jgi:glycosyltransferase involved in cell wall biosynthesis